MRCWVAPVFFCFLLPASPLHTPEREVVTHSAINRLSRPIRAREEQADKLAGECLTIADEVEADSAQVAKARLQVDVRKWHAGKLAPKKYGDRISHDVKGGGINFQPQMLISCSSAGEEQEYIDVSAAPEAAGSLPQQGNGNSLP
jgi:Bacteriophage Sf6, terminase small subunit-like